MGTAIGSMPSAAASAAGRILARACAGPAAARTRLRQRGYDVRLADTGLRRAYHLVPAE